MTGFCQWLGKSGICIVDLNEEEWWITYVDRDPETLERKKKAEKKKKMDRDDEERLLDFVGQQIERDKKRKEGDEEEEAQTEPKYTDLIRENEEEKIKLDLKLFKKPAAPGPLPPPAKIPRIDNSDTMSVKSYTSTKSSKSDCSTSSKKSALEEIMEQEERTKEQKNRKDFWLAAGIVVKVMTRSLGSDYYKQKAVVQEVIDKYRGKIKLLEGGEKFKIDQEHLETVIPKVGGRVRILNGGYRDSTAILKSIETSRFSVTLEIEKGNFRGRVISGIPYEDFSKVYES